MEHLWSPWRMAYIKSNKKESGCVFCDAPLHPDSPENLILFRSALTYVILNRFPYTSGHLMIIPYLHTANLDDMGAAARAEIMELANLSVSVLQKIYQPQGFNVGFNFGDAGGAGIASHVHLHVVPRWNGDTNFMSTLSMTRVLPEALEDSYQRLKAAWDSV